MPSQTTRTEAGDTVFFAALENGHSVRAACAAARYTRQVVYRWRHKDPAFDERWRTAAIMGGDLLEEEADRRGRDGYDKPVFFRGQQVGSKPQFSDALLLARLKAAKPEQYRERIVVANAQPSQLITVVVRDFDLENTLLRLVKEGRVSVEELPPRLRARLSQERSE